MGSRFWWRWIRDISAKMPAGDPKAYVSDILLSFRLGAWAADIL